MKITKIDGYSHYKGVENGEIRKTDSGNELEERVKVRFETTLEGRVSKEFIKKGKFPKKKRGEKESDYKVRKNKFQQSEALNQLIWTLYSEDRNKYIVKGKKVLNFFKDLSNLKLSELRLEYKLKKDVKLYINKNKETGEIISEGKEAYNLIEDILKKIKSINTIKELKKLPEYKEALEEFQTYRKLKIDKIVNSLEKNKYSLKINGDQLEGISKKKNIF